MRFYSAISIAAAGLFCLTPQLHAQFAPQFNTPQAFNFLSDSAMSGSLLGVSLRDIDADRANVIKLGDPRGVEVEGVQEGSPAQQAGLRAGDVLLSYNGETIMGAQQLGRLVSETPRGRKVKIEYWREGKVSTVTAITAAPRSSPFPGDAGRDGELQLFMPRITAMVDSIPKPQLVWRTPLFGIECESLDSQLADYFGVKHGVLVRSVVKDSPAAKAGLRAGDVVTQIGERPVGEPRDLTSYVHTERHSSSPLSLEVTRAHKPLTVKVALTQEGEQ